VLLGTLSAALSLGFIDAILSRVTFFTLATGGFCTPPPCTVAIGGSAFYGQIGVLLCAILLLRFLPQGISGAWRRGQ
jgi:hypothetical protein